MRAGSKLAKAGEAARDGALRALALETLDRLGWDLPDAALFLEVTVPELRATLRAVAAAEYLAHLEAGRAKSADEKRAQQRAALDARLAVREARSPRTVAPIVEPETPYRARRDKREAEADAEILAAARGCRFSVLEVVLRTGYGYQRVRAALKRLAPEEFDAARAAPPPPERANG